jgi:hypothetical protein
MGGPPDPCYALPVSTLVTLKLASSLTVASLPSALVTCTSKAAPSASVSALGRIKDRARIGQGSAERFELSAENWGLHPERVFDRVLIRLEGLA